MKVLFLDTRGFTPLSQCDSMDANSMLQQHNSLRVSFSKRNKNHVKSLYETDVYVSVYLYMYIGFSCIYCKTFPIATI